MSIWQAITTSIAGFAVIGLWPHLLVEAGNSLWLMAEFWARILLGWVLKSVKVLFHVNSPIVAAFRCDAGSLNLGEISPGFAASSLSSEQCSRRRRRT